MRGVPASTSCAISLNRFILLVRSTSGRISRHSQRVMLPTSRACSQLVNAPVSRKCCAVVSRNSAAFPGVAASGPAIAASARMSARYSSACASFSRS